MQLPLFPLLTLPPVIRVGTVWERPFAGRQGWTGHWTIGGVNLETNEVRIWQDAAGMYRSRYISIKDLVKHWRPVLMERTAAATPR